MSFKKALTKMGLIEEEVVKTQSAAAIKPTAPSGLVSPLAAQQTTVQTLTQAYVDPSISEMLSQSLQENKLSGFDYLKFISAVEEMKTIGTPEDARYKMAFFTAKQLGVDKEALVKSGKHYLDVLAQDEAEFNSSCAERAKTEVQARQVQISKIEETITNLSRQLAQLQQDHHRLQEELEAEKTLLDTKRSSFQLTLQNFRSNIELNVQKINQYLT